MTNLLNDQEGRNAALVAQRFLLERRLSRFFKRNLVIDYNQWSMGSGDFDLATMLGDLNDAHDDEIRDLYRLLGTIGGLAQSIADTSIYVDGIDGSDITGTGSATRPYKTLWFVNTIPKKINHLYRVLITRTVSVSESITLTNEFGQGGCLSFIGVGAALEVYSALAGTITGWTSIFGAVGRITTSVIPSSPVNEAFVQLTSGAETGKAAAVERINLATDPITTPFNGLTIRDSTWVPSVGNTYRYITPTPTIDFADQANLTIACNGSSNMPSSLDTRMSHVNFANLNLQFAGSTGTERKFVVGSAVDVGFWFVRTQISASNGPVVVFGSNVNISNPVDDQIATLAASGVDNMLHSSGGFVPESCGMLIHNGSGTPYTPANNPVVQCEKNFAVWCVSCCAYWQALEGIGRIKYSAGMGFRAYYSNVRIENVAWLGAYSGLADVEILWLSKAYHGTIFIGYGDVGIDLLDSELFFQTMGNDGGNLGDNDYSLVLQDKSSVSSSNAWQGAGGSLADIQFQNPNPDITSAFPASGASVTDGLGMAYVFLK